MREPLDDFQTFRISSAAKVQLKAMATELDFPHGPGQLLRVLVAAVLRDGETFLRGGGGVLLPLDRRAVIQLAKETKLAGHLLNQLLRKINIYGKTGDGELPGPVDIRAAILQVQQVASRAEKLLSDRPAGDGSPPAAGLAGAGVTRRRLVEERPAATRSADAGRIAETRPAETGDGS